MIKNFEQLFNDLRKGIIKRSPEILTGLGIAGMISSVVFAIKDTPKAMSLIEEKKEEKGTDELSPKEIFLTTWKCYIPTFCLLAGSTTCIIGASTINYKRNAALATAYSLLDTASREYRQKVLETIGEKKEQAIRDDIAKDKIEKNPACNNEIIVTGGGESLCYDLISGRYFKSNIEKIRRAENFLNKRMLSEMYISLNEFYYEIGLRPISTGSDLGWNLEDGFIDITFSAQLTKERYGEYPEETPVLVLDYMVAPKYDFRNLR